MEPEAAYPVARRAKPLVVFFDIDDTLIDHRTAMRAATVWLHRTAAPASSFEAFSQQWHDAHRRYYPRFLSGEVSYETAMRARIRESIDPAISDEDADRLFEAYLAAYEAKWTLFPDVLPSLDRLRTFRVGIISNGRGVEQRRKLTSSDIAGRFEHVVISEDCGHAKPKSEIFHRACELAHVSPTDAIYIGDQYDTDACAARSAGLQGVWLNRNGMPADNHHGPIIASLEELIRIPGIRKEDARADRSSQVR